jgi:hypothetical protein
VPVYRFVIDAASPLFTRQLAKIATIFVRPQVSAFSEN